MAPIPLGAVTFRNVKHGELIVSSTQQLDDNGTLVSTWMDKDSQPEASRWNLVKHGEVFCIQNIQTGQWMYADEPKRDGDRRWVLTLAQGGGDALHSSLAYQWHIVPHGAAFGLKNAKHDEWLYANGPKLSENCRNVLTWTNANDSPKHNDYMLWLVEAASTPTTAPMPQAGCRVVRLESAGLGSGTTKLCLDGESVALTVRRGLNVAVLEPFALQVVTTACYDIYKEHGERNQFTADMDALPDGYVVLIALCDSGMEMLNISHWAVLHRLGAAFSEGERREGYALIGVKGGRALAEAQGKSVKVTGVLSRRVSSAEDADEKTSTSGSTAASYQVLPDDTVRVDLR